MPDTRPGARRVDEPKYDGVRFRELMLYLASRSQDDPNFGRVKLAKLLYYCDFLAYATRGKPLTGAVYERLPRGPVPSELTRTEQDLERSKSAHIDKRLVFGYTQTRLVADRPADLDRYFSAEDISLVEQVLERLKWSNAADVSALSHLDMGWKLAADGEAIPYFSVYLADVDLSESDKARAVELAQQFGKLAPVQG